MASGLKQRIQTAILIGVPILFLVLFNSTTRLIFLGLLGLLASWEYLKINYNPLHKSPKGMLSFLLGALLILSYSLLKDHFATLLILSILSNGFLIYDLYFRKDSVLKELPLLFNISYIVLPLVLLMIKSFSLNFSMLLISILLLIWLSDIGAYFVGKSIGKRKLFERVSPEKTWEGFLGAGLICVIFSYFFYSYYTTFNVQIWALIALSIWFFGSIGDLVESKFKRKMQIKDSGTIMPGHGGFLDRFDGFIFAIPFVLLVVFIFEKL